jgi:hypothetical protein
MSVEDLKLIIVLVVVVLFMFLIAWACDDDKPRFK